MGRPPRASSRGAVSCRPVKRNVFVSFAQADRPWVEKLGAALARREWNAGIERSQVHSDETHRARTVRDLESADVFLVILSASALADEQVASELELSGRYGSPSVAVRIDDSPLPPEVEQRLKGVVAIAFHVGEPAEQIERLNTALGRAASKSQRVSTMELETLMPDDEAEGGPAGPASLGPGAGADGAEAEDEPHSGKRWMIDEPADADDAPTQAVPAARQGSVGVWIAVAVAVVVVALLVLKFAV